MSGLPRVLISTALLLVTSPAAADPLALRHEHAEGSVVAEAGWPMVSVGTWTRPGLGLAMDWRLPASAVGLSMGTHHVLTEGDRGAGIDLFLAGGLLVPIVEPGLALTATPALALGKRSPHWLLTAGVVLPLELSLVPDVRLRAPVLLEACLGFDPGPLWIGMRGGAGPVLVAPGTVTLATSWSVWMRVPVSGNGR